MDCNTYKKKMPYFADGELPEEARESFRWHTEQCSRCSALYHRFVAVYPPAAQEKVITENPYFYTRVMSRIQANKEANRQNQSFSLRPAVLAATIAIPLFLGVVFGSSFIHHEHIKRENAALIQDMNTLLTYASTDNNEYLNLYQQD